MTLTEARRRILDYALSLTGIATALFPLVPWEIQARNVWLSVPVLLLLSAISWELALRTAEKLLAPLTILYLALSIALSPPLPLLIVSACILAVYVVIVASKVAIWAKSKRARTGARE